ncbi:MAG TPA: hypothetical protein RMH99_08770 [Sandaracinaceae bacterium LLY-WYZ-13_1]|nr:hypothetical protein [Sandaracinaceae bacterium LLY-WYZ-13_1]
MSDPHAEPGRSATSFFALTFLFTCSLQVPAVLVQRGWRPGVPEQYLPLAALGVFGPLATATTLRERGRAG